LQIKKGETLSVDFVIDMLFEYHFTRTDFVAEPGQFAVRGGIIDIFSFSNDYPFRVEFFGDEVETIRSFDPSTQLSVDPLDHITVVPDMILQEGISQRESLLTFLGKQSVLWIANSTLFIEQVDKAFKKTERLFEKSGTSTLKKATPEELFLTETAFIQELKNHPIIFLENSSDDVKISSSPQPNFNKNFDLLLQHLHEYQEKNYRRSPSASYSAEIRDDVVGFARRFYRSRFKNFSLHRSPNFQSLPPLQIKRALQKK
jgi:transcription-repair coupling factor (superfamily II helicase)